MSPKAIARRDSDCDLMRVRNNAVYLCQDGGWGIFWISHESHLKFLVCEMYPVQDSKPGDVIGWGVDNQFQVMIVMN